MSSAGVEDLGLRVGGHADFEGSTRYDGESAFKTCTAKSTNKISHRERKGRQGDNQRDRSDSRKDAKGAK